MKTLEKRFIPFGDTEIRVSGDEGKEILRVQFAKYSAWSTGLPWREKIAEGAFADVLGPDKDVFSFLNHSPDAVLGRTSAGTARLLDEVTGPVIEVDIPDTSVGRDLLVNVKRGDITGASFWFQVASDGATWNDDFTERTITKISELIEAGPVTMPAYKSTSIEALKRMQQELRTAASASTDDDNEPQGDELSNWKRKRLLELALHE